MSLRPRAGVTLIELLVVLVILAIVGTVSTLAWVTPREGSDRHSLSVRVAEARRLALTEGRAVSMRLWIQRDGTISEAPNGDLTTRPFRATLLPDGSIVVDRALGFDRLAGVRPLTEAR